MHEKKFRLWNGGAVEQVGSITFHTDGSYHVNDEYPVNDSTMETQFGGNKYYLMQFTGLKDGTGREIYEGDIVRLKQWEPANMQIAFIEGAFCLANSERRYVGDIHYANYGAAEIIGNIYENPELLK